MRPFSYRNRPVHLGPYPMERMRRMACPECLPYESLPPSAPLDTHRADDGGSVLHAIDDYLSLLDVVRDGPVVPGDAEIPADSVERANNLKAMGYFLDASFAGTGQMLPALLLDTPHRHARIGEWQAQSHQAQSKPLPMVTEMAWRRIDMAMKATQRDISGHGAVLVFAVEYPRDPRNAEPGSEWIQGLQAARAGLRSAEIAVAVANYLRLLGFGARAHSVTSSDIDLGRAAVACGIARIENGRAVNPFVGERYGVAAVTTTLQIAFDGALDGTGALEGLRGKGLRWWLGAGSPKSAFNAQPFARRDFRDSRFPLEKLRRRKTPTTYIDADQIPRVPKRADFFQRAFIGDLGPGPRDASIDAYSVMKHPVGGALTAMLNTLSILQRAPENDSQAPGYEDPQANADRIKATLYFLGADLVGISEAPDWVWYSHTLDGRPLDPPHRYAVTTLIDQGHETMEGASGDDWLSAAQSMRAYLRSSLLNGVVTVHLRRLGFASTNHTASDGDVIQPPLVLLSGLGEASRIGDVMLNPFLGPRLKCGVITTNLPLAVDRPIDFGLQRFCDNCQKCARECPSGAITAGNKVMFNGYEIWRSDAEKCTRYRMTNDGGSMCGRCMKTCPWNLEGIFAEAPFRFLATRLPKFAPILSRIDDWLGNGGINPVKKWWWDLDSGFMKPARRAEKVHERGLNTHLKLDPDEQTLACYPANLAPTPYMVPQPLDREAGIRAYRNLRSPAEYRRRKAAGETELTPRYRAPDRPPPVFPVVVADKDIDSADGRIARIRFKPLGPGPLPSFEAGAHIDVMIAPQFIRQYSLCSDPADSSHYEIGVLREENGSGGSERIHTRLAAGKMAMISRPRNHFPLHDGPGHSLLLAGGIGVTPLIAMGHALHRQGREFTLHYKARTRAAAGFVRVLEGVPWRDRVHFWFSDERRLDVADALYDYREGGHVYTCGPSGFMDAVFDAARARGWPEAHLHCEFFTTPGDIEYVNHDFRLFLSERNLTIDVPAEKTVAEALTDAGIPVDVKCTDGLCGVCVAEYFDGDVEHRDFVLSREQREHRLTLCCSRAANPDDTLSVRL